jgi:hypothetical protein
MEGMLGLVDLLVALDDAEAAPDQPPADDRDYEPRSHDDGQ